MKTFYLKVDKEVINKVRMNNIEDAIHYFASVKKLTKSQLLKIFNVTT